VLSTGYSCSLRPATVLEVLRCQTREKSVATSMTGISAGAHWATFCCTTCQGGGKLLPALNSACCVRAGGAGPPLTPIGPGVGEHRAGTPSARGIDARLAPWRTCSRRGHRRQRSHFSTVPRTQFLRAVLQELVHSHTAKSKLKKLVPIKTTAELPKLQFSGFVHYTCDRWAFATPMQTTLPHDRRQDSHHHHHLAKTFWLRLSAPMRAGHGQSRAASQSSPHALPPVPPALPCAAAPAPPALPCAVVPVRPQVLG